MEDAMENTMIAELQELGFDSAAKNIDAKTKTRRKLMLAYENFKVLTPEALAIFQQELRKKSEEIYRDGKRVAKIDKSRMQTIKYDRVRFQPLSKYPECPPAEVLTTLKEVKGRDIFDSFEVADVESVEVREDPIIFGKINGCPDFFFIAQWDNDLKFEDMVKEQAMPKF
jgi:hypothetical protein